MDKEKPPILCRLWGHKLFEDAAYFYSEYRCQRCWKEFQDEGIREWIKVRTHQFQWRIAWKLKHLRDWLKCEYCGKHFGRHDESQDHIPF